METRYGFPLVNAENVLDVLGELGVKSWPRVGEAVRLEDYLRQPLTSRQRDELRFLPRMEAVTFLNPRGELFTGFHASWPDGVGVFTLLPDDLVPIAAEFRHGVEVVTLTVPGGKIADGENLHSCAKREFEEETGIVLEDAVLLNPAGMPLSHRQSAERVYAFLGIPRLPLAIESPRLDKGEFLKVVLMPLSDWLKLIEQGHEFVGSLDALATFLALRRLGRLEFQ